MIQSVTSKLNGMPAGSPLAFFNYFFSLDGNIIGCPLFFHLHIYSPIRANYTDIISKTSRQ